MNSYSVYHKAHWVLDRENDVLIAPYLNEYIHIYGSKGLTRLTEIIKTHAADSLLISLMFSYEEYAVYWAFHTEGP